MTQLATISLVVGILTYLAFTGFCVVTWLRGITGRALLLATLATLLWLVSPLFATSPTLYQAMEPFALTCWIALVLRALGLQAGEVTIPLRPVRSIAVLAGVAGCTGIASALMQTVEPIAGIAARVLHVSLLIINVAGLVIIEQLARNAVADYRWRVRYLNIALGLVFGFGVVHHALTLFLGNSLEALLLVQPAVMALITPMVAIASLRNRSAPLRLSLSREFVFRSGVLIATGGFLVTLGVVGYLAQLFAGDLGLALAVFGGIAVLALILILVGSTRFRSRLRVILAKTFFEFRYDYRTEWLNLTAQLTEPGGDFDLPQQVQRSFMSVLHAKRACLWFADGTETFVPVSHMDADAWCTPIEGAAARSVHEFYAASDWIVDRHDLPPSASELNVCFEGGARSDVRFVIPMFMNEQLFGLCCVGDSEIAMSLAWEDFDILKLISRQCTSFLALQSAHEVIVEQEQFSAVNQMSAFLMHDIKTITAQLKLMLENATRHKHNPAFVDDMLTTTQNSVMRMERIIGGLRNPTGEANAQSVPEHVDLHDLIRKWLGQTHGTDPRVRLQDGPPTWVSVSVADLLGALNHLIQNGLEAVGSSGEVCVQVTSDGRQGIVSIRDNGPGMTREFIEQELFKPFHSSKGLSGMGIGAFQARSKVHRCGGKLSVESTPGQGSVFEIALPLVEAPVTHRSSS